MMARLQLWKMTWKWKVLSFRLRLWQRSGSGGQEVEVLLTAAGVEEQMEWRRRIIGLWVDGRRSQLVADCDSLYQTARLSRLSFCFCLLREMEGLKNSEPY